MALLAALVMVPAGGAARASTAVAMSLAQMVDEADFAFIANVSDIRARWVDPERSTIETLVFFADAAPRFGISGNQVVLRFGGGRIGGQEDAVAGIPQFRVGEEMLILGKRGYSVSPIVGFNQGYFRIVKTPAAAIAVNAEGRPLVARSSGEVEIGAVGEQPAPFNVITEYLARHFQARPEEITPGAWPERGAASPETAPPPRASGCLFSRSASSAGLAWAFAFAGALVNLRRRS